MLYFFSVKKLRSVTGLISDYSQEDNYLLQEWMLSVYHKKHLKIPAHLLQQNRYVKNIWLFHYFCGFKWLIV